VIPSVSIIVPAHNEAALLGATLRALNDAVQAVSVPCEIIVVDDASTDGTVAIARDHNARVVSVSLRHIAAARNAGARVARGELLVFVDADTFVPAGVLGSALEAFRTGAVGGGALARMDEGNPRWAAWLTVVISSLMRLVRWAAGCFIFARRDVFERVGGFDERYFASEEIHLSRMLKKHGRVVIIREPVITSGRKADAYTARQVLWQVLRLLRPGSLKRRDRLAFWYGEADQVGLRIKEPGTEASGPNAPATPDSGGRRSEPRRSEPRRSEPRRRDPGRRDSGLGTQD
jgi:glycosyltransferase involved in cell wall biosynthesis